MNRKLLTKLLTRAVQRTELDGFSPEDHTILVYLVNNRTISKINREHLNHRGVTDVITFHYPPDAFSALDEEKHVYSEIFVSTELASQKYQENDLSLGAEVVLYAIHGILHLGGHNDYKEDDIKAMRAAEKKLMNELKCDFDLAACITAKSMPTRELKKK